LRRRLAACRGLLPLPPLMRRFVRPSSRLFDRRLQPQLDQPQHMPVANPSAPPISEGHRAGSYRSTSTGPHRSRRCSPGRSAVHFLDCVDRTAFAVDSHRHCLPSPPRRSVSSTSWRPVCTTRSRIVGMAERTFAAPRLGDHHPPHRLEPACASHKTSSSRRPASHTSTPCASDLGKAHSVHARRTRIAAGQCMGVTKNVFAANLS